MHQLRSCILHHPRAHIKTLTAEYYVCNTFLKCHFKNVANINSEHQFIDNVNVHSYAPINGKPHLPQYGHIGGAYRWGFDLNFAPEAGKLIRLIAHAH